MPESVMWNYNDQLDQWEAVLGPWKGIARPDTVHGIYVAELVPAGDHGPQHMAPHSFEEREEAMGWCEAEVRRLTAEACGETIL